MNALLKTILTFSLLCGCVSAEPLKILFFSGGGKTADTGHNGRMNHHKLIPDFLRSNIDLTYSDQLEDLNPETLSLYEAVIMYRGGAIGKPERIENMIDVEAVVAMPSTTPAEPSMVIQTYLSDSGNSPVMAGIFTATHVLSEDRRTRWHRPLPHGMAFVKTSTTTAPTSRCAMKKDAQNHGLGCAFKEQAAYSTPPMGTTDAPGKNPAFRK